MIMLSKRNAFWIITKKAKGRRQGLSSDALGREEEVVVETTTICQNRRGEGNGVDVFCRHFCG